MVGDFCDIWSELAEARSLEWSVLPRMTWQTSVGGLESRPNKVVAGKSFQCVGIEIGTN